MSYSRLRSNADYTKAYAQSIADPEAFWAAQAGTFLWRRKWDSVLDWDFDAPKVEWFKGGRLNITENCLDRHLAERGEKTAILWEPNDPGWEAQRISYRELHARVCRFANVLKRNGAKKGDRVCIYMPMIPDLAGAVLACARIGAIHSVVFAGFSAQSIADRIQDADAAFVITSDGMARGGKKVAVKAIVDEALERCPGVKRVMVVQHTGEKVTCWPDVMSGCTMS